MDRLASVVVDGIDMCQKYGLILTNDSVLNPPEVRTNFKEIPAMDGYLDLSEVLTDDAVFGERVHELVFFVREGTDFEWVKTDLQNWLHGKAYDYQLSFDPGYTYHGRWVCDSYFSRLHYREVKFTVHADPYKVGAHMVYEVQGAGGATIEVENGRRKVIPWITTNGPTLVKYGSNAWVLEDAGTWTIDGLRLSEGTSSIYFNSAPTLCTATLQDVLDLIGDIPCKDIPEGTRLTDHYFLEGDPPEGSEYAVRFEYDIQEL